MGKRTVKWPPPEQLLPWVEEKGTRHVARELNCSPRSVRERVQEARELVETPQESVSFVIDKKPPKGGWTPEALLKAHGLNPAEWWVSDVQAVGNQWGDPEQPNEQVKLKVSCKPVRLGAAIQPPDLSGWKPLPKPRARKRGKEPMRCVVISDHHAPRHEKTFHQLFVRWLREHQPDLIDINGDLLDFPDVSHHRTRDEYNHSVNECLRTALHILRDYREACPNARIRLKRGNHDERLDIKQIDNAPEVRKVSPGGGETVEGAVDERPWHHLERLLYLDLLHIEYVDEHWEQAKTKVSKKLTARHGFSTSPNAGKIMLDKLSGSTIQGHDHRFAMTLRTRHTGNEDNPLEVRLAMSGGCACEIPGGLGYVKGGEPDWQNGAIEVLVWDDGDFLAMPIIYVPGRMLCKDGRYSA